MGFPFLFFNRNDQKRTPDDKLRWAFKMYDEDNSREVDKQEMENVMVVSLDNDGDGDCFLLSTA